VIPDDRHRRVLDVATQAVVDDLLPVVRRFATSDYGIALGGAHAKGTADPESDLDLYVFSDTILSTDKRVRLLTDFGPPVGGIVSWGDDSPFVQAGTDFLHHELHVECWMRSRQHIDSSIAECNAGTVRRDMVSWTTTGFYNHCALSDLQAMIPLEDPVGMLASWRQQIQVYPPRLRRAIIQQHVQAAAFWPANFHYSSAVERTDVIYTTGIVQQVLHNMVQVLFALNEVYFPGDKKVALALGALRSIPDGFVERMLDLLAPGQSLHVDVLRAQQQALQVLLAEIQGLVEDAGFAQAVRP
jgi:predicted nucleotidyltransferase